MGRGGAGAGRGGHGGRGKGSGGAKGKKGDKFAKMNDDELLDALIAEKVGTTAPTAAAPSKQPQQQQPKQPQPPQQQQQQQKKQAHVDPMAVPVVPAAAKPSAPIATPPAAAAAVELSDHEDAGSSADDEAGGDGQGAAAGQAKRKKTKRGGKNKKKKALVGPDGSLLEPIPLPSMQQAMAEEPEEPEVNEDFSDTANERAREYRKGGYHPVYIGELYNDRYRIAHKLGWGFFSTVWLVWDYRNKRFYAMKVQKSDVNYRDAAYDEIRLLTQIMEADPANERCCTRLVDTFEHTGPNGTHVVMVFEVLGENLLKLIERYDCKGIPLPIVKAIARQTLIGLDHVHSINIIHTDIKPENVLLTQAKHKMQSIMKRYTAPDLSYRPPLLGRDPATMSKSQKRRYKAALRKQNKEGGKETTTKEDDKAGSSSDDQQHEGDEEKKKALPAYIQREPEHEEGDSDTDPEWDIQRFQSCCLADFGNSCWTDRQFTDEVQTRQYRAPEVIVGTGYGTAIDIWSAACMFFELITGEFLFDPKASDEYPRDEDHLALIIEMLGPLPAFMSRGHGKFIHEYFDRSGRLLHIHDLKPTSLVRLLRRRYRYTKAKAQHISDFLLPMLQLDPSKRATARDMLVHFERWFDVLPDDYAPHCFVPEPVEGEEAPAEEEDDDDDLLHHGDDADWGTDDDDDDEFAGDFDDAAAFGGDDDAAELIAWTQSHPCLAPAALAARGLALEDIVEVLKGRTLDPERMAAAHAVIDQLQMEADEEGGSGGRQERHLQGIVAGNVGPHGHHHGLYGGGDDEEDFDDVEGEDDV
jgi:serine/threonine-protein kinase SRPK3